MRRVMVVGNSGAGKSTFTGLLAEALSLPPVYLDLHYWRPGWRPSDIAVWRKRVAVLAAEDEWVMDGCFAETFDLRMPRADTLIWLDPSTAACLVRVAMRAIRDRNRTRPDLPDGCREGDDFMSVARSVWNFPRDYRPKIDSGIETFGAHLDIVRLTADREVRTYLAGLGAS